MANTGPGWLSSPPRSCLPASGRDGGKERERGGGDDGEGGDLVEVTNGFTAILVFLPTCCSARPNIYTVYIWDVVFLSAEEERTWAHVALSRVALSAIGLFIVLSSTHTICTCAQHSFTPLSFSVSHFLVTCCTHSCAQAICLSPLPWSECNEITIHTLVAVFG